MLAWYSEDKFQNPGSFLWYYQVFRNFFLDLISTDQYSSGFGGNLILPQKFPSQVKIKHLYLFFCFHLSQWILKIKVEKLFGLYQTPPYSPRQ